MAFIYFYFFLVLLVSFFLAYFLIIQIDKTNILFILSLLYGLLGITIIILINIIKFQFLFKIFEIY